MKRNPLIGVAMLASALAWPAAAQVDSDRRAYDDDSIFEQMSGAKRALLEAKFGKRPPVKGTGLQGAVTPGTPAAGRRSPLAPIASASVNDPALDVSAQRTQSETTVLAIPASTTLVSAFNDSGGFTGTNSHFTGIARSVNSGTSFTDLGTPPVNPTGDVGDPVLARSANTGTILLATLSFDGNRMEGFRSTDNGLTYGPGVNLATGTVGGSHDKEWIACDNTAAGGTPAGYGNFYHIWRDFGTTSGIRFTRSTDDGLTWVSLQTILAGGGQGSQVVVGADHAVYAFWYDSSAGRSLKMRKSVDQGVTFAAAVTVTAMTSTGSNGDLGLPYGFRSSSFPQVAAHPTLANVLYIVYPDPTAAAGGDRGNIFLRTSTDGGTTWGAAVQVNTDATTRPQWMPTITVSPNGANMFIGWYSGHEDPAFQRFRSWGAIGTINGAGAVTLGANFAVADQTSLPVFGQDPVVNAVYMGDYDQSSSDNTNAYFTYTDTRNGNQDVRFTRIPWTTSFAALSVTGQTITGGNGNGTIETDECNNLFVTLTNIGNANATAVVGTLSTATPGVTVVPATANQSFGTINAGASATNASAFQISTSPTFICGTPIVLNLVVAYAPGGPETLTVTIPTAPPTTNYTRTTSAGAVIVPGVTLVPGTAADDATAAVALPFTYTYFATPFNSVNVSTNGNIQFTSNSSSFSNVCPLPTATFNNAIMPYWDDLLLTGGGQGVFTSTSGVAPNRIFNIEWRGTTFTGSNAINFEVRLYEGQQKMDFIYANSAAADGSSASIGIQRGTGGSFDSFLCNTAGITSGLQVTYTGTTLPCGTGGGACGGPGPGPGPGTNLPTFTVLTSNANPQLVGQPVTFTARVVAQAAGFPSGTIQFRDGGTVMGTAVLNLLGVATFTTSSLTVGSHTITAFYGGDANFLQSLSALLTEVISPLPASTTTVTSSANPSLLGSSVTFTANVTSSGGTPTGTVTFKDGATTLGTGTLATGKASFSTSALTVGSHSITAVYGGSSSMAASTSAALSQVVNANATTTTLTSSKNPAKVGDTVTFTATVAPVPPASGTATGTVTFKDGSTTIGTGTLASGVATLAATALAAGVHSITAVYGGDATFAGSTSAALSQSVTNQGGCTSGGTDTLCVQQNGRFQVKVAWTNQYAGNTTGVGTATAITSDSGFFTFFSASNIELAVKVLDGRSVNGKFWVSYASLTDVGFTVTVTDTSNSAVKTYTNAPGTLASVTDVNAFAGARPFEAPSLVRGGEYGQLASEQLAETLAASLFGESEKHAGRAALAGDSGACTTSGTNLCLNGGRFQSSVTWKNYNDSSTGVGTAIALTGDSGYFWFFSAPNVELMMKVLDGTAVNGKFWVLYGSLTDVEFHLTVTDTSKGTSKTYDNAARNQASKIDINAF